MTLNDIIWISASVLGGKTMKMLNRMFLIFLFVLLIFSIISVFSPANENPAVWEDDRDGNTHIYYKNLETSTTRRISWTDSYQYVPTISGSRVVWQDNRDKYYWYVYYKNLKTGECNRVSWVNSDQYFPVIGYDINIKKN